MAKQTDPEMPPAETLAIDLEDEELDRAQGGLGIKQSRQGGSKKQRLSTDQGARAIGDTLVSVEAES